MKTTRPGVTALLAGASAALGVSLLVAPAHAATRKATTTKAAKARVTTTVRPATTAPRAATTPAPTAPATSAPRTTPSAPRPAGLDAGFGKGGVANVALSATAHDRVTAAAIGPDGKIYAGGYLTVGQDQQFAVIRVDGSGALDKTFGTDGVATVNVAVGGRAVEQVRGIAVQSNGKVVAAGPIEKSPGATGDAGRDTDVAVVRFDAAGKLDTTFGTGGVSRIDFGPGKAISATAFSGDASWGLLRLANDRLAVIGNVTATEADRVDSDFAIAALSANGALDTSFGRDGVTVVDVGLFGVDSARNGLVQPDGKIVASGYSRDGDGIVSQVLIRLDPVTGARDTTFGTNGVATGRPMGSAAGAVSEAYQVAQHLDGFVAFGYGNSGPTDPAKLDLIGGRYSANGQFDRTWGTNGGVRFDFKGEDDRARWAVGLPDGRLLAAGSAKPTATNLEALVVLRDRSGAPVSSFGTNGAILSDLGGPGDVWFGGAISADQTQVVLVGYKGTDANSGGNDDAFVARINL